MGLINGIAIGSRYGDSMGYPFHARRIKHLIEAHRFFNSMVGRMIGEQQGERNLGVECFRFNYSFCSKMVKLSIVAYNKFLDAALYNVPLNGLAKRWIYGIGRFPVSNKETAFPLHTAITNPFELL